MRRKCIFLFLLTHNGVTLILQFLIAELNAFYLKFVLWFAPDHPICIARIIFIALMGTVAMRETFEFLDNP